MLLSLKCHNCGATVYFDNNEVVTCCSHCGAHLKEMTEYTLKAVDLNIKQQSANIDINREKGISDIHAKETRTAAKGVLLVTFGIVGAIILMILAIRLLVFSF